jgi:hypothetical protein
MEGEGVEAVRRPRIMRMVSEFDPGKTELDWLYIHYFSSESPPDQAWAFEETTDFWGSGPLPRRTAHIVIPPDALAAPHPWER